MMATIKLFAKNVLNSIMSHLESFKNGPVQPEQTTPPGQFREQVKLTHCCQVKECIVCHRKRIICHFRCYRSPYQNKTFAGICFVEGAAQLFRGGERNNQSHQILLWSFWNFDLWKQTNQPQPKNMTKCVDSPASAPDQRHWLRSSVDPPVYGLTHDHCLLEIG